MINVTLEYLSCPDCDKCTSCQSELFISYKTIRIQSKSITNIPFTSKNVNNSLNHISTNSTPQKALLKRQMAFNIQFNL